MSMSNRWIAGIALSSVLLSGCVSKVTQQEQYSGFLSDYQGLQEQTTPSGQKVLRWVAPGFNPATYSIIAFKPLKFYPAPKPNERISQKTLQDLQIMASESIKTSLARSHTIVRNVQLAPPGSRALILKAAITDVSAANEGMHWYEVVPVAAVVGATQAAIGRRDQTAELYIEAELIDAKSGVPVAKVVRKVLGETLDNASQPIVANDFKVAFNGILSDVQTLLSKQEL